MTTKTMQSGEVKIDGILWLPVRDAANLIESTPATIYNQVGKNVIRKKFIGKNILLVSKEDTIKYGESKKTYFERFTKEGTD